MSGDDLVFFLMNIFDKDDEIITFCYDHFFPVYGRFEDEMNLWRRVKILSDHCQGPGQTDELETWLQKADNLKKGEKILRLLKDIDSESMFKKVQGLYQSAYEQRLNDPEGALKVCQEALKEVDQKTDTAFNLAMPFAYARGKFYLLIASIHLDAVKKDIRKTSWKKAEENYRLSAGEFNLRSWSHLAGLANLGLAIALRKLKKFEKAMNACSQAERNLAEESIPSFVKTNELDKAIREETSKIQDMKGYFSTPPPPPPEEGFPVFHILSSKGSIVTGEVTGLNLLSREDYKQYEARPEEVIIDLIRYPSALNVDYILEIDPQAKVEEDLKPGDWLLIQAQSSPDMLHGKTVTVLVDEDQGTTVGLRTCIKAEDHYFLKAKSKNAISIIIVNYKTSLARIRNLEALYYGEKRVIKRLDATQVSGAVIDNGRTLRQVQSKTTGAFIWRIPQISNISAGLDHSIAEENIEAYVNLREQKSIEEAVYFTFIVDGDSMNGDGIFSGDNVLIRQQAEVENGDIAAVVINTPDLEKSLGTLKRYYSFERKGREHWFLKSSNPTAEHLVVVPPDIDIAQIRRMYGRKYQADELIFYQNAELSIAGKYIRVVEKA